MINCGRSCLSFTAEYLLDMSSSDLGVKKMIRATYAVLWGSVLSEIEDIACVAMKTKRRASSQSISGSRFG